MRPRNHYGKDEGRRRLSEALRATPDGTQTPDLDPVAAAVGRRIQDRGITSVPGVMSQADLEAQDYARRRQALSELAAEAERDKAVRAQRKAELEAQRRLEAEELEAKLNILGMGTGDVQESDPVPSIPLNSGALLDRAAGHSTADLFRTAADAQGMTQVGSVADALRRAAEGK